MRITCICATQKVVESTGFDYNNDFAPIVRTQATFVFLPDREVEAEYGPATDDERFRGMRLKITADPDTFEVGKHYTLTIEEATP